MKRQRDGYYAFGFGEKSRAAKYCSEFAYEERRTGQQTECSLGES